MAEKLYYSMGEVTEMFDVEASLIRYWCSQFSCLRPKRNSKGNRMFTQQDLDRLKRIYHLLKEKKMTIEGAQKAMKRRVIEAEANDSDVALLERLQSLRASLVEMRDSIADLAEDVTPEKSSGDDSVAVAESETAPKKKRTPRRKLIGEEGVVETPLFPFYEQRLF
ncbi:MAG: MerR family transcriptional regulator [Alistipes sp.]|nr:MerR family transcriptional regulator [Alistipes sp.]